MDKCGSNSNSNSCSSSSSFLIKNLLSPPDRLNDNALALPCHNAVTASHDSNEHAIMVMQMKLAFDWLAHLQQLQGQNASEHASSRLEQSGREIMSLMEHYQLATTPKTQRCRPQVSETAPAPDVATSTNSFLDAFDSRPESQVSPSDKNAPVADRWDLKLDRQDPDADATAFRPFSKTNSADQSAYRKALQSQCGKKLLLHRIISLMMPQFRPSLPNDELLNPLTNDCGPHATMPCSMPVNLQQQFAMDRMKMEQLPSGVHPLNRTLSKYPIAPFSTDLNVQRFCSINSVAHYQSDASIKNAEQARKDEKGEKRRKRTTFTQEQLNALEHEFQSKKYLTLEERAAIADTLGLSQVQIKIWWQNRRASYKRSKICLVTNSPGDAASSNSDKMPALSNTDSRPKIVVPIPVHVSRRMTVQHGKHAPSIGRALPNAPSIAFGLF